MKHHKTLSPSQLLQELNHLADAHAQRAIAVYQNLPEQALNQPSATGGWSIAQCLDHLNSYSRHYLPLIQKAVEQPIDKAINEVVRGWLGDYFIKMMDPDLKPAKYKAAKKHLPSPQLNAYEVVGEFILHQEHLIQLLAMAEGKDLNGLRITTSISSMISLRLGDTLAFLVMHDERHIRQADRNVPE